MQVNRLAITAIFAALPLYVLAQTRAEPPPPNGRQDSAQGQWKVTAPQSDADAYFPNLKDGAKIETPYRLKFGLGAGWGLAPISSRATGKSGHHHLLINRDLPLDFEKALPFNDQYVHFGKGQMETILTLEPGNYTLRLLLADDKHVPRFVYSKPIKVTVTKRNKGVDPKSLITKGIELENLPAGAKLSGLFKVGFHASGLNVAHLSQAEKDTGHFRLTIIPKGGGKPSVMDFVNGETEVWLAPPPGGYTLKLDFVDNAAPDKMLVDSITVPVQVQ
jgi:hypothetical protein